MLRTLARLLLPYPVRRPIADRVYRLIAWSKNISGRSISWRSPQYVIMAMIFSGYRFFWDRVAAYRYLLEIDPAGLRWRSRLRRQALKTFLTLPDWYYRHLFSRLSEKRSVDRCKETGYLRSGAIFIIGGLGAGGSERQLTLTMTTLAKEKYGPLLLFCRSLAKPQDRFYLPQVEAAGIPVNELYRDDMPADSLEYGLLRGKTQKFLWFLYDVADYVRTFYVHRPAVAHLWLDEVNIKGGIAAVITGIPRIVLGLRSLPPCNFALHQPYMREGYRWLIRQRNVVVVNNSFAGARAYERWLGLLDGTIHVIHNGFDFDTVNIAYDITNRRDYRSFYNFPDNGVVVGTVIRMTEEKRPMLWLEVAAAVRRQIPNIRFLIAGDGPMMNEMKIRAGHEDLDGSVYFTGNVQKVYTCIAVMDIFLLTSRAEGFPNVLIEAQASGVPVVTTDAGGASETLRHGITGWVLEQHDVSYIADILVKLINDHEWRETASKEAMKFVKKAFNLQAMIDQTLTLYQTKTEMTNETDN